jgi:hypothetical protein
LVDVTRLKQEQAPAGYEVFDESCTASVNYPRLELLARIFMPAANPAEADAQDLVMQAALAAFSPHPIHPPEPYWKEPGWYEHYFELTPADHVAFDAIVALVEGDWHISSEGENNCECDAVWNPSPGHVFLLPGVTWAHILLNYPNPLTPDQEYLPL